MKSFLQMVEELYGMMERDEMKEFSQYVGKLSVGELTVLFEVTSGMSRYIDLILLRRLNEKAEE